MTGVFLFLLRSCSCFESSLHLGLSESDSQLSITYSGKERPCESDLFLGLPEGILSCLYSCLRSFLLNEIFQSWRKQLNDIPQFLQRLHVFHHIYFSKWFLSFGGGNYKYSPRLRNRPQCHHNSHMFSGTLPDVVSRNWKKGDQWL